jgi:transcriptional regulator with XRE-family HTH domain
VRSSGAMAGRKQPRALVKGSVLQWARESLNLSIEAAAKRVKLDPDVLRAWEAEQEAPSVPQLRKLADAYKRPLIVFYLPEPPKGFDAMRDFRRPKGRGIKRRRGLRPSRARNVSV